LQEETGTSGKGSFLETTCGPRLFGEKGQVLLRRSPKRRMGREEKSRKERYTNRDYETTRWKRAVAPIPVLSAT